jgi:hypothetical protein
MMEFNNQHRKCPSVRSCAIYRAIKALYKPHRHDKSRSYAQANIVVVRGMVNERLEFEHLIHNTSCKR